jgi:ribosome maturation factor RimP
LLERFLTSHNVNQPPRMNWQDAAQRTVTGLKYELVDLERTGGGLLRVYIDRVPGTLYPTGASELVTVDDCEVVTRQLQYVLEVEQCDYTRLEVSSPGLDRPLKREADYARFVGSVVALTLKLPLAGRKKFEGVLAAREGGWRLEMAPAVGKGGKGGKAAKAPMGTEPMALDFVLDEVREANLVPVVDFKGRARVKGAETAPMQAVPSHVGE